jgi:uncharacterized FlaG/YvyC family protein
MLEQKKLSEEQQIVLGEKRAELVALLRYRAAKLQAAENGRGAGGVAVSIDTPADLYVLGKLIKADAKSSEDGRDARYAERFLKSKADNDRIRADEQAGIRFKYDKSVSKTTISIMEEKGYWRRVSVELAHGRITHNEAIQEAVIRAQKLSDRSEDNKAATEQAKEQIYLEEKLLYCCSKLPSKKKGVGYLVLGLVFLLLGFVAYPLSLILAIPGVWFMYLCYYNIKLTRRDYCFVTDKRLCVRAADLFRRERHLDIPARSIQEALVSRDKAGYLYVKVSTRDGETLDFLKQDCWPELLDAIYLIIARAKLL